MGDYRAKMMRTLVFVAILIVAIDAISFEELERRADEADHPEAHPPPPPKKVAPKLPTLAEMGQKEEMQEWSTDHLLGLDAPPPTELFKDLQKLGKPKPRVHRAKHVTIKKVAPKKKMVVKKKVVAKKPVIPSTIVPEQSEEEEFEVST